MIKSNVLGVEFIVANTDEQALARNLATHKISLGHQGLGAGAKPEMGRAAAETHREEVRSALQGAQMVFITAGMGGGTGTGGAPIVAEVAREMDVLTVGIVTRPFSFEGSKRAKVADAGIIEFSKYVDSLIVILNDKLMEVMGDDAGVEDCFKAADDVLKNAVGGIAEVITQPGLVNVDFEDVRTVMEEPGHAMMGSAMASGPERAREAAERAVASPLLEGAGLSGARGVLINISASHALKMREVNEAMDVVKSFAATDAHIIFGTVFDDDLDETLRVTVVATGLSNAAIRRNGFELVNPPAEAEVEHQATGTDDATGIEEHNVNYEELEKIPAVARKRGDNAAVEALVSHGVSRYDIPAFLRKQSD